MKTLVIFYILFSFLKIKILTNNLNIKKIKNKKYKDNFHASLILFKTKNKKHPKMQPIYKLLFFLTAWMISLDHSKKKKRKKKIK
jgi:hypothetical protein